MTLTLDNRARMLLLTLLIVLAAGVAGFMWVHRVNGSDNGSSAAPAPVHRTPVHVAPTPVTPAVPLAMPAPTRAAKPHVAVTHAKPKPVPKPKPVATPAPPDQLPAAIRRALANGNVVVVSLYDPRAKIDGTALGEAKAGAKLAGTAFVKVDVRSHGVDSLNARYGAVQDPAILVLSPPGTLVVRIDGFADRDTVAQAAANATS
jgi:hypothetical protein